MLRIASFNLSYLSSIASADTICMGITMKIAVCIKQVPLPQEGGMDAATGTVVRTGAGAMLNVYDLPALETALVFKERSGGTADAFTMGPPRAEAVLKEAFAMGIDKGYLISDKAFSGADVLATSYTLMQALTVTDKYDLIICGRQTTDGDTAQVGGELAQFLGIPYLSMVEEIVSVNEESVVVRQRMSYEQLIVKTAYPCVLAVEPEIYKPRIPSLKLKLAAKKKAVNQIMLADLDDKDAGAYGSRGSATKMVKILSVPPAQKTPRLYHDGKNGVQAIGDVLNQLGVWSR